VAYHIVHLFGGDTPLFGFAQPPVLASASERLAQAQAVKDLVDTLLACHPHANIIVLGDLNDFQVAPPVETLQGDGLTNLIQVLPLQEQYSYVFEGHSQVWDQMLVSANLCLPGAIAYAVVLINTAFATQVSDHDPSVARLTFAATLCSMLGHDRPPSLLDQERFTFAGHAGEEVTVRFAAGEGTTAGRATLTVFGPGLWRLANSALPKTIPATRRATGIYSIAVAEHLRLAPGEPFRGLYCLSLASSQNAFQTLAATSWVE
jgi:Endonuclease/Exonuclease/phosphatase family